MQSKKPQSTGIIGSSMEKMSDTLDTIVNAWEEGAANVVHALTGATKLPGKAAASKSQRKSSVAKPVASGAKAKGKPVKKPVTAKKMSKVKPLKATAKQSALKIKAKAPSGKTVMAKGKKASTSKLKKSKPSAVKSSGKMKTLPSKSLKHASRKNPSSSRGTRN